RTATAVPARRSARAAPGKARRIAGAKATSAARYAQASGVAGVLPGVCWQTQAGAVAQEAPDRFRYRAGSPSRLASAETARTARDATRATFCLFRIGPFPLLPFPLSYPSLSETFSL